MNSSQGFWSYVHTDDTAERGRISELARDVVAQYEMLTGETIDLFLDRDAIEWGDEWRHKIDESLASVAFFIPVITPRYFMRPECRRELQFFARRADRLGIRELVLPLLYVDVPSFEDESIGDDLVDLVRKFQYVDWRELRYVDISAEAYRRGVAMLASRLVAANKHAETVHVPETTLQIEEAIQTNEDDLPGLVDRMANAEEALPSWNKTLDCLGQEITKISRLMQDATVDISKKPSFSARLKIARHLAKDLNAPTENIVKSGNEFTSQLHDVDEGFRAIIERGSVEISESPESKEEFCRFFRTIKDVSLSANRGLGSVEGMINAIVPLEKMSRDLRPVLRRLRQGLTVLSEARVVTDSWISLIDASEIDCQSQVLLSSSKKTFAEVLGEIPDVGEDSDFERLPCDLTEHVFD